MVDTMFLEVEPLSRVMSREIGRFIQAVRQRSEVDEDRRRRARKRYRRSWPMSIAFRDDCKAAEHSVALHNASELGVAFLSTRCIEENRTIYLRLFWHDEQSPRIPAVVRHITPVRDGFLIGCEFTLDSCIVN